MTPWTTTGRQLLPRVALVVKIKRMNLPDVVTSRRGAPDDRVPSVRFHPLGPLYTARPHVVREETQMSYQTPPILPSQQNTDGISAAVNVTDDFRLFADNIPTLAWMAKSNGHIFWYNRCWYEYCGTTPEQMEQLGCQSVYDPAVLPEVLARWSANISSGACFEMTFPLRGADGVFRPFLTHVAPVQDADGRITHWVGINTDVTRLTAAEHALSELTETLGQRVAEALNARKVLADIVEATDAFVQVADLDYRWLAINRASADEFERIFGVRPRIGASMLDILADQPEHQAAVKAVWGRALAGEEFTEVGAFGDPIRDRRHYEMKFNVLYGSGGERIGAYQFVTDVTERLREQARLAEVEETLRQSQKMEAVGQLTGGLAHDFNNLLSGIMGNLEMLRIRIVQGRTSELDRFALAAEEAARRAAALTNRLLTFSRTQMLEPISVDVNQLIAGLVEFVQRTVGPAIEIKVVGASGLWSTRVDPSQLENALLNLCINARDAMPDGGRITIETANRELGERSARALDVAVGEYVSLCVSDTGTGIAPEVAARAFEPFFTTKPIGKGTGLGLSMVYGFVRQSGGQACICSEPGEGAMVCLYLPRHHGTGGAMDLAAESATVNCAGMGETVLVVDDEPSVRMLLVEMLGELGYSVLEAEDGPAGLRILQSNARVDLLITDVGLPGGLNGRQVADAARVMRPRLKVLIITGYGEVASKSSRLLEPGMQMMTKPFSLTKFAGCVRTMLMSD